MSIFQDIPIQRKLTAIIMLTSSVVLLLASAAFLTSEVISYRRNMVEELSALEADIGLSAILVCLGVAISVLLFFRWALALPAIALSVAVGTAWGFGISSFFLDSLTTTTAFLGSIIIGNGINPAIMLTARGFTLDESGMADTGIKMCLNKPFSPREVLKLVEEILVARPLPDQS